MGQLWAAWLTAWHLSTTQHTSGRRAMCSAAAPCHECPTTEPPAMVPWASSLLPCPASTRSPASLRWGCQSGTTPWPARWPGPRWPCSCGSAGGRGGLARLGGEAALQAGKRRRHPAAAPAAAATGALPEVLVARGDLRARGGACGLSGRRGAAGWQAIDHPRQRARLLQDQGQRDRRHGAGLICRRWPNREKQGPRGRPAVAPRLRDLGACLGAWDVSWM